MDMNNIKKINAFQVKPANQRYQVLSLFSGAGGMDLGFTGNFNFLKQHYDKNPFKIVFANDIFKQAADVYEYNFHLPVERRSINDLNPKIDLPQTKIDVVLGGFPCQSFSYAGKRKGLSDKRGQLYLQMIKVIKYYRPQMFIAENVDGIKNSHKDVNGNYVAKSALTTILHDFEKCHYHVQCQLLNAADYGVPQLRKRIIIIGLRSDLGKKEDIYYPQPVCDQTGIVTGHKWITAKDTIDDLWYKLDNTSIPNHTSKDVSKAKFYVNKKLQGNRQIKATQPAPTIRAEHHGNIEAHYRHYQGYQANNPQGWRRLSVRECARLQSFPDNFNFTASASVSYKAIGNAVPPVLAWHIARSVLQTLTTVANK